MKYDVKLNKGEWEQYSEDTYVDVTNLPEQYKVIKTEYRNVLSEDVWNVIRLKIYKEHKLFATVNRNYPSEAESVYVKQGKNEYLVTSGDYMCITVVNLTTGEVKSYTDEEKYQVGAAFCPYAFDYDDGTLFVTGCVWGGWEETYCFPNVDFSNPVFDFDSAEYVESE